MMIIRKFKSCSIFIRDVPNIHFVFASFPNSGPNSVFVFGQIVSSERIRIVILYSVMLETSTTDHSVSASCFCSDSLIMGDE